MAWYTMIMPKGEALTKRAGSGETTAETTGQEPARSTPSARRPRSLASLPATSTSGISEKSLPGAAALAPPTRVGARAREEEAIEPTLEPPVPPMMRGYANLTPEVLADICAEIEKGRPIRHATDKARVNYEAFKAAMQRKPEIAAAVDAARAVGTSVWMTKLEDAVANNRSIHGIVWMLGKLYPKAFSDRLVDAEASNEAPVMQASVEDEKPKAETAAAEEPEISREEASVVAKALYEHRKRKRAEAEAAAAKEGQADGKPELE